MQLHSFGEPPNFFDGTKQKKSSAWGFAPRSAPCQFTSARTHRQRLEFIFCAFSVVRQHGQYYETAQPGEIIIRPRTTNGHISFGCDADINHSK
jgi:hypothetical protein